MLFLLLAIKAFYCLESYETIAVLELLNHIEDNIKSGGSKYFCLLRKEIVYLVIEIYDDKVEFRKFVIEKEKEELITFYRMPNSINTDFKSFTKRLNAVIKQYCLRVLDATNVMVCVDDNRYEIGSKSKVDVVEMLNELIIEDNFKNCNGLEMAVFIPRKSICLEHSLTPWTTYNKDQIVIKYLVNNYHENPVLNAYYYQIIPKNTEFITHLKGSIQAECMSYILRNYILRSSKAQKKDMVCDSFYQKFPFNLKMLKKKTFCDNKTKWGIGLQFLDVPLHKLSVENTYNDQNYKIFFEHLTEFDIKGLFVLFFVVYDDKNLFLKIIKKIINGRLIDEDASFSLNFLSIFVQMRDSITKGHFNFSLEENVNSFYDLINLGWFRNLNELGCFLVVFFIQCSDHFKISLVPEVIKMAQDFDNRCVLRCFISEKQEWK